MSIAVAFGDEAETDSRRAAGAWLPRSTDKPLLMSAPDRAACNYQTIPMMPEVERLPLSERFVQFVGVQPVFQKAFVPAPPGLVPENQPVSGNPMI